MTVKSKQSLLNLMRCALAATFLFSGLLKGVNLHAVSDLIRQYAGLTGINIDLAILPWLSVLVCVIIVAVTTGVVCFNSFKYDNNVYSSILIENIEALTDGDDVITIVQVCEHAQVCPCPPGTI